MLNFDSKWTPHSYRVLTIRHLPLKFYLLLFSFKAATERVAAKKQVFRRSKLLFKTTQVSFRLCHFVRCSNSEKKSQHLRLEYIDWGNLQIHVFTLFSWDTYISRIVFWQNKTAHVCIHNKFSAIIVVVKIVETSVKPVWWNSETESHENFELAASMFHWRHLTWIFVFLLLAFTTPRSVLN